MDSATEQRFRGLDVVVRRQRLALYALCLLVAASALTSLRPPSSDTIRATRFVVVDETGSERAALGLHDGQPSVTFRDDDSTTRAALGLLPEDRLLSRKGAPFLSLGPENAPLAFLAEEGTEMEPAVSLIMSASEESAPSVRLEAARDRATLLYSTPGGAAWGFTPRAFLAVHMGGGTRLDLRDAAGTLVFSSNETVKEYDGSSHFPVASTKDARAARREQPTLVDAHGPGVDDDTLEILASVQSMQGLILRGCPTATPRGLAALARATALRSLDIMNCAALDDADLSVLGACKSLASFTLLSHHLGRGPLESLRAVTSLERLALRSLSPIDLEDAELLSAIARLPRLRSLDLSALGPIPPEVRRELLDGRPGLNVEFGDE